MKPLGNHRAGQTPLIVLQRIADSSAPARRVRHRKPPLETRSNWDPWLPAEEAYPEVPRLLAGLATLLLALLALFGLLLIGAFWF